jgi:hypothetical protein
MNRIHAIASFIIFTMIALCGGRAAPLGSAFTYHGRLTDGGAPATGLYDFQFIVYDASAGGSQHGITVIKEDWPVTNGLFTTDIDIGPNHFTGDARWLEISVRAGSSSGAYSILGPRQALAPAPYALYAPSAGLATSANAVPWGGLTGVPASFLDGIDNDTLYSAGAGLTLSGTIFSVNFGGTGGTSQAARSDHHHDATYWNLAGNSGTTPVSHFLGTLDNQPVELRVNNARALRLEPTAANPFYSQAPNVIGGSPFNQVVAGIVGATIGGGGAIDQFGNALSNHVAGDFGTIGGGAENTSSAPQATVSGGYKNTSSNGGATVGGGTLNTSSGLTATVGGGIQNTASGGWATIGGGLHNTSSGGAATVAGGEGNLSSGRWGTVGGGYQNTNFGDSATIAGGRLNTINANWGTVSGGEQNMAGGWATVPGGLFNIASGEFSLAAGRRAKALHYGAFVWADGAPGPFGTGDDFTSTSSNQFLIRATGGVGIGRNNPASALDVLGTVTASAFAGDGAGLLSLNGGNITSGTVGEARIDAALARDSEIIPAVLADDGAGSGLDADLLDGLNSSALWQLSGNSGTTPGTHFLGTTDNQPLELKVSNLRALRLEPTAGSVNLIGGFGGNFVAGGVEGATIGGGGTLLYAPFGLAYTNRVFADFGTIGGGFGNTVRDLAATIGGGFANSIASNAGFSTISGGAQNRIRDDASIATISGGLHNTIDTDSPGSTLSGGERNYIHTNSGWSVISGGQYNTNRPNASFTTISGGANNMTTNSYAVVPGGRDNMAGGAYSLAAGRRAKANHSGGFVWADSTDADFGSTAADQFLIRATGGVGIGRNNPASALDVLGTVTASAFAGDGAGLISLNGGNIASGIVSEARIDVALARDSEIMPAVLANDGAGSGLDADLLDGLSASAFAAGGHDHDNVYWKLLGNGGTAPGVNFLGTTDNQALELKVNNARALRLEPNATTPNLLGGSSANSVSPGVVGATIGGGGATFYFGLVSPHTVAADFGTVGGGLGNAVQGFGSTIGGGSENIIQINTGSATIGGGNGHTIQANADFATISGGNDNVIQADALYATISGGKTNLIQSDAFYSTIGGGWLNTIEADTIMSTVSGGYFNGIGNGAFNSTIGGGRLNRIETDAASSTISGGTNNIIRKGAHASTIGGGRGNIIQTNADHSTIAGGAFNGIKSNAPNSFIGGGSGNNVDAGHSTIAGGQFNFIQTNAGFSTISGGYANGIETNAGHSVVGGGYANRIRRGAGDSTIAGGNQNTVYTNSILATIAGGYNNTIGWWTDNPPLNPNAAPYSTIGGGADNTIVGASQSTIGGGDGNAIRAEANGSTIGGGNINLIHFGSFSSTIGGGSDNVMVNNAPYSTIGGGQSNTVGDGANYATVPGGRSGWARRYGQMAYASGRFADNGDAQTSVYVLRRTTTAAALTELFLNGSTERMTLPPDSTWTFDILVAARSSGGSAAGYEIKGVIENQGGVTSFVGVPTVTALGEQVAAWNADVEADNANDALAIKVTGAAATTIRWVATVRTVEVIF